VGPMAASLLASLITLSAGILAAACLIPKRHVGSGDSWISFAIGALAGPALLEILPRVWQDVGSVESALALAVLCAACCFALDRLFHCRRPMHGHGAHCYLDAPRAGLPSRRRPGRVLLVGDFFHSVVDGSLIAAAFTASLALGIVVTVAIVVHEIPRKCATVLMLVHGSRTRRRALLLGGLSGLGTLGGVVATSASLHSISSAGPVLLFGAAVMTLYVAVVELLPAVRPEEHAALKSRQTAFMLLGIACVGGAHLLIEPII